MIVEVPFSSKNTFRVYDTDPWDVAPWLSPGLSTVDSAVLLLLFFSRSIVS